MMKMKRNKRIKKHRTLADIRMRKVLKELLVSLDKTIALMKQELNPLEHKIKL